MATSAVMLYGAIRRHDPAAATQTFSVDDGSREVGCPVVEKRGEGAGHSLRAGLATSAAAAGVEERQIMAQTRHRSVAVARRYIRDGSLFRGNAAATAGL